MDLGTHLVFPFALTPVSFAQSLLRARLCAKRSTHVLVEFSWRSNEGSGKLGPKPVTKAQPVAITHTLQWEQL